MYTAPLFGAEGVRVLDLEVSVGGTVKSCVGEIQRLPEAEADSRKLKDSSGIEDRPEVSGNGGGGGGVRL
eukprot:12576254-Alexandrium_andersonii.AAC.1